MKRQPEAGRRKNWTDIAIDSWIRRRGGHPVKKKASKGSEDWVDVAIDSWIRRRHGKSGKSSRTLENGILRRISSARDRSSETLTDEIEALDIVMDLKSKLEAG